MPANNTMISRGAPYLRVLAQMLDAQRYKIAAVLILLVVVGLRLSHLLGCCRNHRSRRARRSR